MQPEAAQSNQNIRYKPDERLSHALSLGLGFQYAALIIGGIVLTPAIIVRAAGGSDAYLSWAAFAALTVSGLTTVIQAVRVGRIGAGYPLLMGTSGAFIAVCVTAMAEGGPGLLATLVVLSSLFQFALSERLALFRRLITPAVAGTVIMLISVTIMPITFQMLTQVPAETPSMAAPTCAIVTFVATMALILCASGVWRLWAPMIGVVLGCLAAGWFGLYDVNRVLEASWIGVPDVGSWLGFDFEFGSVFWALFPAFIFVTLVGVSFWVGAGFQNDLFFAEYLSDWLRGLLGNGMTAGWRNWNLSPRAIPAISRIAWPCSVHRLPKMRSNTRFHSGCCATSPHPCATSSIATRILSQSASRLRVQVNQSVSAGLPGLT